jgi:hypothetical protein
MEIIPSDWKTIGLHSTVFVRLRIEGQIEFVDDGNGGMTPLCQGKRIIIDDRTPVEAVNGGIQHFAVNMTNGGVITENEKISISA